MKPVGRDRQAADVLASVTPTARAAVPELDGVVVLADTGIETDLIFNQRVDLPLFAAFVELDSDGGRERLDRWHRDHATTALANGLGAALDAVTWRASSDWGDQLGYDAPALDRLNQDGVRRLLALREELREGLGPDPAATGCRSSWAGRSVRAVTATSRRS